MTSRYIIGDTREVVAGLDDNSVDLILTSPPFLALRSYLPADHPDKHREIGSEPTPADFIDTLLDLTEEWARVLAPHGSLCVELGDTYSSAGGITDNRAESLGGNDFAPRGARGGGSGWPLDKSLCLVPQSYAWALTYGRNPFNGRETPPWRVRNIVRWCRPNPPVGALGDKFRPATSELVVACKARDRWFDLDAVREEHRRDYSLEAEATAKRRDKRNAYRAEVGLSSTSPSDGKVNAIGAPPLDYWEIPTQPYAGSHYATFPEKLCVRPILSMCPTEVCLTCGEPRRRIVGEAEYINARSRERVDKAEWLDGELQRQGAIGRDNGSLRVAETLGWSDCGHNSYRRGIVLDPFAGSGTTLAVAEGHARDSIGIDLDPRNATLAYNRIGGLFLTIEHHPTARIVDTQPL